MYETRRSLLLYETRGVNKEREKERVTLAFWHPVPDITILRRYTSPRRPFPGKYSGIMLEMTQIVQYKMSQHNQTI